MQHVPIVWLDNIPQQWGPCQMYAKRVLITLILYRQVTNKLIARATVAILEEMVVFVRHALLANTRWQRVMQHVQAVRLDCILQL
jgi:hypothetical protein